MTLQDLGSIGEFVAAIATLITLIYLAVQIRESSQVSRLSLQETFVSGQEEFFHSLLANEETYGVSDRLQPMSFPKRIENASVSPRQRSSFAFDPEFVQIVDDRIRKN